MAERDDLKATDLRDLVPSEWFSKRVGSSIWIRGYRVHKVNRENLPLSIITNMRDVQMIALYGTLSYLDSPRIEFTSEHDWVVHFPNLLNTPEATYLLLLIPYAVDGQEGDESKVRQRLDAIAGLMIAINGRKSAYNMIFDNNILNMSNGEVTVIGPPIENPLFFPAPDFSANRLREIVEMERSILLLPENERNRIRLSLRWFAAAMQKIDVDYFVSIWIALEILGMGKHGKLEPLNTLLARIYGLPDAKAAKEHFRLDLISGLRARIAHHGEFVPIHQDLSRYIESLYVDILMGRLQLPSEYRAQTILDKPGFDLNTYLV